MMADVDVLPTSSADITAQSTTLRAELKEWERTFAAANGGKKAGRDDIKQNPEIGMSCLTRQLENSRIFDPWLNFAN